MTLQEKIRVMQQYENHHCPIERASRHTNPNFPLVWYDDANPSWNWADFFYRRKPTPRKRQGCRGYAGRQAMKTIEQVETELRDTLARERKLREALGHSNEWPVSDVLDQLCLAVNHLLNDHDCDIDGHEQFRWAVTKATDYKVAIQKALSTPAPRVFTAEECRPLVEALHWMELTEAAHSNAARAECKLCRALDRARKLGMEGEG